MILFKQIKYKNFLSTGDAETVIDIDSAVTTLVVGKNGAGKCLRGNTQIDINFKDNVVKEKFANFMKMKK